MIKKNNFYKADKGFIFVLTETGRNNCASWKDKKVGEPVDSDDTYAPIWAIEKEYLKEVPDPDWIVSDGYQAVYNCKGHVLSCGNPTVFPFKWMAERAVKAWESRPWNKGQAAFVQECVYEGKKLREMRSFNGKPVYNSDTWMYDGAEVGDLVEEEIVSFATNCMPSPSRNANCSQLGEPADHRVDEHGQTKATYPTFKKINDGIWQYCGNCFAGKNTESGKPITL